MKSVTVSHAEQASLTAATINGPRATAGRILHFRSAWFALVALAGFGLISPARGDVKQPTNLGFDADLASLPHYKPTREWIGILRIGGGPLGGLVNKWEAGFQKFHPRIKFRDNLLSSEAVSVSLAMGVSDLGTTGDLVKRVELIPYNVVFGCMPLQVTVGTGSLDIGSTPALVILSHKDNPISKLTIKQLDGIFGSARTGGFADGYILRSTLGRTAKDDIRTWGQLGLTGEWADKQIQTYGYAMGGFFTFMQQRILKGAEINWNPNYRQYSTATRTPIEEGDQALTIPHMFRDMSQDRYSLGWGPYEISKSYPSLKPLALAENDGGPYIELSAESLRDRSYPLVRDIYIYTNRPPGHDVDPKVKEFITYVLSYEGQLVALEDGRYFPLPAVKAREELRKLE
ncbi:MAG: hypothetical protein PHQ04_10090 [Opitutaceae bacterium]|nr:hypothetical protein [Opitutaceae bacterium]